MKFISNLVSEVVPRINNVNAGKKIIVWMSIKEAVANSEILAESGRVWMKKCRKEKPEKKVRENRLQMREFI